MVKRLALAFALGVSACSVKDEKGDYFGTTERFGKDEHTFYVNNLGEPEYVDPGMAHDSTSSKLIYHLFEGLAQYGPDAEAVPGVAERYDKTDDNQYFRFHLRDDARWNDGQPVTAHDFEYAWKRVLDPKTASQSSTNLYFVKNGELFNQGKLLVARETADVKDGPDASAKLAATLQKGDVAFVVTASPVSVATAIPALTELPAGVESLGYDAPNPKKKLPEKLTLVYAKESKAIDPDAGRALPKGDYDVVRMVAPTVCNGDKTYYFEVVAKDGSGRRGILPGCMLEPSEAAEKKLLVARWTALPSFDPKKRIDASEEVKPIGFVDAAALAPDTSVLGVRATDDHTLEVETEYPAPFMLDVICQATSYPVRRDVVEKFKAQGEPDMWTRPENIVTNGPYEVDAWRFRYEIRMRRNPKHRYFDKLKIHDIVWMAVESNVAAMNLYKAGELDYSGDNGTIPPPYRPVLKSRKDFERVDYLATYWYELNTKVPPLDDANVRRALNLAIDKKELAEKVTRGGETPATHFVPNFTGSGYSKEVERARQSPEGDPFDSDLYSYNPALARELLGKAGFQVETVGDGYMAKGMPPIELLYNTNEGHKAIAIAIQANWKKNLGISVQLRNEEWGVMLKNVRDRNFQVVRFGWIGDYDHPQTWMDTFMAKSPNNRTGWSSAAFEALIDKARKTADVEASMKLYREAEKILADEVPKIPLYFYSKTTLVKPYVKGHHFNRRNEQLVQWMWIDPDWKKHGADDPPAFEPPRFDPPGSY